MFWDLLITGLIAILVFTGNKHGLIASWRGPFVIAGTTLIVQRIYIDFAAWLCKQTGFPAETSVTVAYMLLWILINLVLEILASLPFKVSGQRKPGPFDRAGGAIYGLAKALIIVILPLMALSADIHITPPQNKGFQPNTIITTDSSVLLPHLNKWAKDLMPTFGKYVVSEAEPGQSGTSKKSAE
jgi:uncharacterized membrane protein required for colicin V production